MERHTWRAAVAVIGLERWRRLRSALEEHSGQVYRTVRKGKWTEAQILLLQVTVAAFAVVRVGGEGSESHVFWIASHTEDLPVKALNRLLGFECTCRHLCPSFSTHFFLTVLSTQPQPSSTAALLCSLHSLLEADLAFPDFPSFPPSSLLGFLSKGTCFPTIKTFLSAELRATYLGPLVYTSSPVYSYDIQQVSYPLKPLCNHHKVAHLRVQSLNALSDLFSDRDLPIILSNEHSMVQIEPPKDTERSISPENQPDESVYSEKHSTDSGKLEQFADSSFTNLPPLTLDSGDFELEEEGNSVEKEEEMASQLQFIEYEDCSVEDGDPVIVLEPKFRQPEPLQEEAPPRVSIDSSEFATLYFDSPILTPQGMSSLPSPRTSRSGFGEEFDSYGIQPIPVNEICLGRTTALPTVLEMMEDGEAETGPRYCSSACLLL